MGQYPGQQFAPVLNPGQNNPSLQNDEEMNKHLKELD